MNEAEKPQKALLAEAKRILGKQYEAHLDFNGFFDGEEPISISSPRKEVNSYQYERSKVLFWLDRDAYDDERTAWENETHQAKHKEVIELIRGHGRETPFQDLLTAVERGRVVPFIGAGLSKPMGMPLWAEALRQLLPRLPGCRCAEALPR